MSTNSTPRWRKYYNRLRSSGFCGRCGSPKQTPCPGCEERNRAYGQKVTAEHRCRACGNHLPPYPYAFKCCEACREKARERYTAKRRANGPQKRANAVRRGPLRESMKWAELEASQAHCEKCGLRGPHECLPSIRDLASARRGPGAIEPEGGPTGCRNARGYVPGLGMVRIQMRQNRFPR